MKITGHKEQPASYYDAVYKTVEQKVVPRQKAVAEYIEEHIEFPNILDVGCGCGTFAEAMYYTWEYRGFDFSEEAIKKALQRNVMIPSGDNPYNFWVGDCFDHTNYLPLDYNVIVCGQVLEHVDDLRLLRMFPREVRIICTVPMFDDPAHVRYYESLADVHNRFNDSMRIDQIVQLEKKQIMIVGEKP